MVAQETEPTSSRADSRKALGNFAALGGGEAIGRLLAFAASVWVARQVGVAGFGVVSLAAGVTLYLAKVADFGIESVGTGEVAQAKSRARELASAVIALRLAITTALVVVASAIVVIFLEEPERTVFLAYFLTLFPIAASTRWVHLGLERAGPIGLWRGIGDGVALLAVVALVHGLLDLWKVPISLLIGEVLAVSMLYGRLRAQGLGFVPRFDLAVAWPIFRKAVPVMTQILLGLLLFNADLVFLRFMEGLESVGLYAAAYTPISFAANLGMAFGMSLLPTLARQVRGSREESELYGHALAQTAVITLPILVAGFFLAPALIAVVFGEGYESSAWLLQILLVSVPISAFRIVPWSGLIAVDRSGLLVRATLYAVIANVGLNFFLIGLWGAPGAAVATVGSEGLAAVLMLRYARREGMPAFAVSRLLRPLLATAAMGGLLFVLRDLHFVLLGFVGVAGYGAALAALRVLRVRNGRPVLEV